MPATTWRRKSGHLDLEELVDPLAEQDQELDPLEERDILGIGHQVEQPVVEVEVRELAGEVPGIGVVPELLVQPPHGLDAHCPTIAIRPGRPSGAARTRRARADRLPGA